MKAFGSGRSDQGLAPSWSPSSGGFAKDPAGPVIHRAAGATAAARFAVPAVAAVWLLAHLPFLAPALEDIDSINFALGLHHFDPALHQPHPPGYPVFIAAGRLALAVIHLVMPALSYVRADALALAIWSAIGGTLAIVSAGLLFEDMVADRARATAIGFWGAVLMALTPLFWMTGLRPMSDMFGLGVALAAQALILRGTRDPRALVIGAAIAGLAAGIRTQTVPLTLPMLAYALAMQRGRGVWLLRPAAAFAGAGLTWGIPLLIASGGIDGYLHALGSQAGEDFAWVDMVWANPTPRTILFAAYDSFVLPFASPAAGGLMLAVATLGAVRMLFVDRRAALLIGLAFGPYALFHLLFQEGGNLRYSTPLVPAMAFAIAFLAVSLEGPLAWRRRRLLVVLPLAVVLVVPNVLAPPITATGIPIVAASVYGREAHPAFRAIADMAGQAAQQMPAGVFAHFSLRRPLQAAPTKLPIVEPRRSFEWLGPADYWLKGGRGEVWFLADPARTDLALIDPQVRTARHRSEYVWSVASRPELMGTRPLSADWYRLPPPGWFAGEGWELTPETAGIARASHTRLQERPITAYVRRRREPMAAIVAGRHLGPASLPASVLEISLDGKLVDRWPIEPRRDGIKFFRVLQLPDGIPAGAGSYAELTLRARAASPGAATPEIAVEQFDVQPTTAVMFAFGDGWHEAEYSNRTGVAWRWTSDHAVLRVVGPGPVTIHLQGESPLKYVAVRPNVRVGAGDRQLATFRPDGDFAWTIPVPADALAASGGIVTIDTDQVYLPGPAEGTADARRLGLRIFETSVEAAGR